MNIKTGIGGIREIEFFVQGKQMIYASKYKDLINGNTLDSLEILKKHDIVAKDLADSLASDYIFLRTVEHCLQILEDRQLHSIPSDKDELTALAKRAMGTSATYESFSGKLTECIDRVHSNFENFIRESSQPQSNA